MLDNHLLHTDAAGNSALRSGLSCCGTNVMGIGGQNLPSQTTGISKLDLTRSSLQTGCPVPSKAKGQNAKKIEKVKHLDKHKIGRFEAPAASD